MTRSSGGSAVVPQSLGHLRLQLTAWYVGTFFAILTVLGIAMFVVITNRLDRDVDDSLRTASQDLAAYVAMRGPQGAIDELRVPNQTLIVTDASGRSIAGAQAEPWLAPIAAQGADSGAAHGSHEERDDRILRASATRVRTHGGSYVAIAVGNEIELEDRYRALIAGFGSAALGSLLLVAIGGWWLARKSTAPVEHAIAHMRRFMADAAHELRTPITVARSRAEVALQRPRAAEDYVQALRGIEAETTRLSRIVDDLLTLARVDVGERPIERRRVFLDDITVDAADAARVLAARKSIRVDIDEFDETPVLGDETLLRQLVLILLDNAIKFTNPNGSVRVAVRAVVPHAELTVSDTGIGIGPDDLEHVFERFYRGDPSRTRAGADGSASNGAGLGLSIAEWIVDEHGASMEIASQPGQGTRVTVLFPAADGAGDGVGARVSSS